MANYKNTYAKRKKNGTAANIGKGIAIVLVTFLAIGLIGSVFGSTSGNAADPTDPVETEPTEEPVMITFEYIGDHYQVMSGTTFEEWIESGLHGFDVGDPALPYLDSNGNVTCSHGYICLNQGSDIVKGTDVIVAGGSYCPM